MCTDTNNNLNNYSTITKKKEKKTWPAGTTVEASMF